MKTLEFGINIDCEYTTVDIDISDKDYAKLKRIHDLYEKAVEDGNFFDEDVIDPPSFFAPDGDGADIYARVFKKALPLLMEQAEEFGHLPEDFEDEAIDEVFDITIEFPENFE